ncbi:MAG TPA: FtsX-like permease family protein [Gammaproteobacteria bacterium]|nr:FtsX-like permease family protein [Gammaproteobacteria bacterium]
MSILGVGSRVLLFHKWRFTVAGCAIAVAVTIMFTEMGFFFGILDSQTNIAGQINGDLVVMHRTRTHLNKWNTLRRIRLQQIEAIPGVKDVLPIYKGGLAFTNPETGKTSRIIGFAFPPDSRPLNLGQTDAAIRLLKQSHTVLFDRESRAIYGNVKTGQQIELDGVKYRIGGFISMGPNIINDGAVIMSDGNWFRDRHNNKPIMGIIRLHDKSRVQQVKAKIQTLFGSDLQVFTPADLRERELHFTVKAAPIGMIFGIGMLAGLVIGISICYQVLFTTISDNTRQYATLKAIGFSNFSLLIIILEQALLLSFFGFSIGLAITAQLYELISQQTALIMQLTLLRSLFILLLTTLMCILAGLLAMRKVIKMEPAELF